jgi:hypothetical protein
VILRGMPAKEMWERWEAACEALETAAIEE